MRPNSDHASAVSAAYAPSGSAHSARRLSRRFPFRASAILTLCGTLGLGAATAQKSTLVSDFEMRSNMADVGGFWYFYDDHSNAGESVITTADSAMQYMWDTTAFTAGAAGSQYAVDLGFVFGAKSPVCGPNCTYAPQVGMGINVAGGLDITGATAISFWAKAKAPMKVVFTVGTSDVKDNGYYAKLVSVTAQWAKYTVALKPGADFAQPSWSVKKPFDPANFTSLGWMIGKGDNAGITAGDFMLDNVSIEGWEPPVDPASLAHGGMSSRALRPVPVGEGRYRIAIPSAWQGRAGVLEASDLRGRSLGHGAFGSRDAEIEMELEKENGAAGGTPVYLRVTDR